jgi:hypothetical protein
MMKCLKNLLAKKFLHPMTDEELANSSDSENLMSIISTKLYLLSIFFTTIL